MTESVFDNNPDYALRWPPELLAREVELLSRSGRERGMDSDWRSEVETLLSLAFASPVPADDFARVLTAHAQKEARAREERAARQRQQAYISDEEPF